MGVFTTPLLTLKIMLSQCVGFQKWAGVDQEADPEQAALAKIFIEGLPFGDTDKDELTAAQFNDVRPYALIYTSEGDDNNISREGEPECFDSRGATIIVFSKEYLTDPEAPPKNPEELWLEAMGQLEQIADADADGNPGLAQLGSREGGLRIGNIRPDVFGRTPINERNAYGDAFDILLIIRWG